MKLLSFITKEEKINSLQDLELAKGRIQLTIMKMVAFVLGLIMMSVVFIFMIGLFLPNDMIDNNEIFKIIAPAFSMIVGAFVGAFATMMGMKTGELDPNIKLQELGQTDYVKIQQARSIEIDNDAKEMELVNKYKQSDEDHGPF
jgi:hypothetical protein